MHYFITSRIDKLTSAIELAEIKRLKIFKSLQIPAKIITLVYSRYQQHVWRELGIEHDVINPIAYFQRLSDHKNSTAELRKELLSGDQLVIQENRGFINDRLRIEINMYGDEIDYVTYLDRWGFTDRRDFYVNNQLSFSEYFDDKGKLITRTYFDYQGIAFLTYHYRGGPGNVPVLTLIQLRHSNSWIQFDQEINFWAYFLTLIVKQDSAAVLYSDREDYVVPIFKLMNISAKKFIILHSAFTQNAQADGEPFPYIKEIFDLGNQLSGIIVSTSHEANDLKKRPKVKIPCYAIPVSFLPDSLLEKQVPFESRIPGQLIAVARLTPVKQLDQLINAVILLHQKLPFIDLKIYGYDDDWQNYETSTALHHLVKNADAANYIHFCGYLKDLTQVYQSADIEVVTSAYEGFSMATLEALGHGCPVVSYDINYGPNELIKNNKTGNLIPAGDTWSLQRTLSNLLIHREILKRYNQNISKTMLPYSQTSVAKDWSTFISQINAD